jgi:hypothetical protein
VVRLGFAVRASCLLTPIPVGMSWLHEFLLWFLPRHPSILLRSGRAAFRASAWTSVEARIHARRATAAVWEQARTPPSLSRPAVHLDQGLSASSTPKLPRLNLRGCRIDGVTPRNPRRGSCSPRCISASPILCLAVTPCPTTARVCLILSTLCGRHRSMQDVPGLPPPCVVFESVRRSPMRRFASCSPS